MTHNLAMFVYPTHAYDSDSKQWACAAKRHEAKWREFWRDARNRVVPILQYKFWISHDTNAGVKKWS